MSSTLAIDGRWDDAPTPKSQPLHQPQAQPQPQPQSQPRPTYLEELLEVLRVVMVAGIGWGLVGIGLGSRLAMFLLRLTSPDSVRGVLSDDGFIIGRFTLSGSYNLAVVGAAVGVIGAAAYVAVAPWLIGPTWFRRFTVALTSAAIGGSATIHYEGIDFQALKPQWFAIVLFIALPFLFGLGLSTIVDRVAQQDSWTRRGATAWVLPLALLLVMAANPLVGVPPIIAAIIAVMLIVRRLLHQRIASSPALTLIARAIYFAIALYGFYALGNDLAEFA